MKEGYSWCRTDITNTSIRRSAVDHIYCSLEFRGGRNVALYHLQNLRTCAAFMSSLSCKGFENLEIDVQDNLLCLMLGNVALFAPYKLSDILIPFIESRNLPGKSSFLSTLAQQVLLDWTLRQPSNRIDEVLAATILKVLEAPAGKAQCNGLSRDLESSRNVNFDSHNLIEESASKRVRTGDSTYIARTSSSRGDPYDCTWISEQNSNSKPSSARSTPGSKDSLAPNLELNEIGSRSEVLSTDNLTLIMSSLKDIDWLGTGNESSHLEVVVHSSSSDGKKNSNTNSDMLSKELSSTGTKRTELEVDGEHARSVSTTATDLGSKLMPFSYEEREVGHVAQGLPIRSTEQTSAEHALRASHPKDDLTSQDAAETPQIVLKIKESVTGAKSQGEQKEIPVAIIADIHPVAGIKSSTSVDNSVDKTLDNKVHYELLVACRAHRASVLRSTMSAGTGSLPPSVVQQLSLSACQLLIRIGDLKSALPESSIVASSQNDRSQHTPSQGLSQSLSQQDDITDEMQMYSIDTLLLQAAALLALCLHRAPDDILAAVSDQLLTRISSESKQSQWQNKEQIQPITAIIFLSGVLLTRIRSLSAPASRLLLRALEVGVKKTPDDMLSFILPLIAGTTATLQPASQHHELLQRVARQVLSGVQCDELVYHLCFQGSLGSSDSLTAIQAAGRVFDVLLPAAVTGLPQVAPKIAGGRVERGTKSSSSSTNVAIGLKQMKRTDGRLSGAGMELTVAEQDLWSVRWTAIVNSLLQLPDGDDSRKRWNLLELGRKLKQEGIRVDVELSKVVNSILTMIPTLSVKTAVALLDRLDDMSAYLSESSAHTESGSSVAAASRVGSTAITSLTALVYTIVTRFPKTLIEASLKKEIMTVLGRLGSSAVAKAAAAAVNKLH